jgi:hypothetical protein
MPFALRWSVVSLLGLLGLAGLVQLPLLPPLTSRTGEQTDRVLADLASQESLQDARARASETLSRFVGAEITRYYWGGFTPYLDVLGLEAPEDMDPRTEQPPDAVQLLLIPREGEERYVARVQAQENVPRAVMCRGSGDPQRFPLRADRLQCPAGWQELDRGGPERHRQAG